MDVVACNGNIDDNNSNDLMIIIRKIELVMDNTRVSNGSIDLVIRISIGE